MVQFMEEATPLVVEVPVGERRVPWHLWAVGGLSLLWNALGAVDYTMSQLRNEAYLGSAAENMGITTAQMIGFIDSFPAWMDGFWAVGVWGALIGSILLLTRSRYAVWTYAISLLGLAVTQAYQAIMPKPEWAQSATATNLIIWAVAIALLVYAVLMRKRGVLR